MLTETEEKFFTDRLEKMSLARIGNDPKEEIIEPEIVDAVPIPSASSSEQKNDSLILESVHTIASIIMANKMNPENIISNLS